ncbi:MAG: hypothetical protein IT440_15220 [Phycisphaeraceae bacterium]|nr:hypothetical protein [Phycisphaeraceae bacterium]
MAGGYFQDDSTLRFTRWTRRPTLAAKWRLTESKGAVPTPANVAAQGDATPAMEPTDPRWVLALRVSEALEGDTLRPDRRERIAKLGQLFGLSPFDVNLIIAMVQDQARRGLTPDLRMAAVYPSLTLISPPRPAPRRATWFGHVILALAVLTLLEVLIILSLL